MKRFSEMQRSAVGEHRSVIQRSGFLLILLYFVGVSSLKRKSNKILSYYPNNYPKLCYLE